VRGRAAASSLAQARFSSAAIRHFASQDAGRQLARAVLPDALQLAIARVRSTQTANTQPRLPGVTRDALTTRPGSLLATTVRSGPPRELIPTRARSSSLLPHLALHEVHEFVACVSLVVCAPVLCGMRQYLPHFQAAPLPERVSTHAVTVTRLSDD